MSAQGIRYQERKIDGSWRYAVLALVAAIAITIAIVMANAGPAGQTTTGGTRPISHGQGGPQTAALVVPDGPAGGHPLP
jgi:hypothetical protein